MKFSKTEIPGVWLIEPIRHGDSRGYFSETFRADLFAEAVGKDVVFVQDNESMSQRGVVRGLHYQAGEASQAKLVRVCRGAVIDVVVDLRRSSPTFGQHIMVELSSDNGRQLFIPRGMAHGFVVVSEQAQFQYKTDNYYTPSAERTILFNDPSLGINLPISESERIISPKDLKGVPFSDAEYFD